MHFSGSGEIYSSNIIDFQAEYSIGSPSGVSKAFDIFINNGIAVNPANVVLVRPLREPAIHLHPVLETYQCWGGVLFAKSQRYPNRSNAPYISMFVMLTKGL